ncbi:hypothetical protein NXS19_005953 [Fusarium pseudograminearum]|nr:hypothetical protein NXS19_005953 [Fusarium pseudograminearum]
MGYSEILCRICGVSFNINRYRTDQEPPSAALGESLSLDPDRCPDKGGCYFINSSLPPDEQIKHHPSDIQETDLDEDGWTHVAGPDCGNNGAYNGHRISLEAMRGCNTFQCLVYKPEDWTSQTNDEDFESKGKYFLSGLGDDMPSRDIDWPTVFPHRHDVDAPRADECIWNEDEADECAMPFHPTCLEIYKRVSLQRNGVVDIEGLTLWWRREGTYEDFHQFPRDQAVIDAQEQWWSHDLGNEYLAANPCFIPGFQSLLQSCQDSDTKDFEPAGTAIPTQASTNDPFAKTTPGDSTLHTSPTQFQGHSQPETHLSCLSAAAEPSLVRAHSSKYPMAIRGMDFNASVLLGNHNTKGVRREVGEYIRCHKKCQP